MCFLDASFTENCYRSDLRHFKINEIVSSIWTNIDTNQFSYNSAALN